MPLPGPCVRQVRAAAPVLLGIIRTFCRFSSALQKLPVSLHLVLQLPAQQCQLTARFLLVWSTPESQQAAWELSALGAMLSKLP